MISECLVLGRCVLFICGASDSHYNYREDALVMAALVMALS